MLCAKCGHEIAEAVAFCPYCGEKMAQARPVAEGPIYQVDIKGLLKSGKLMVYRDRTEFVTSSVQKAIFYYANLVSVKKGWDCIDFITEDGRTESCPAGRKTVHEAFLYVKQAVKPYLTQRRDRLLSQGVRYSFPSSQGFLNDGVLNLSAQQAEFRARSGKSDVVSYRDVKSVSAPASTLDFLLFGGGVKSFAVSKELRDEVLAFVNQAIEPYVAARTVGFDTAFGIDERIEINEERSVFHIIRQSGREITGEWPLSALARCEWVENEELNALGSVVSGGIAIFKSAAKAAGSQTAEAEDRISCAGPALTLRTEQGDETEHVWFGIFSAGMSRTNKKYDRYLAGWTGLSDYLKAHCPECELIEPAPPEPECPPLEVETAAAVDVPEPVRTSNTTAQQDELGITKYIEGVSRFIISCETPMAIAFQGNRGSGESSPLNMLFNRLKGHYGDNLLWLNARLFSQDESGEALELSSVTSR